jgi:hypothetical protein
MAEQHTYLGDREAAAHMIPIGRDVQFCSRGTWGDRRSCHAVHIFNLQADHIAAAQLPVDGWIEHGRVPGALLCN